MKDDVRVRARSFLERPAPPGASIAGSLTDGFIRRYLAGGPWDDPELRDLLRYSYLTAKDEVESESGEVQVYFRACAEVLRGIVLEIYGPEALA